MRKGKRLSPLVLFFLLSACSVKVVTDYKYSGLNATALYEPFGIIESDTIQLPLDAQLLGSIEVKGGPFSVNCDEFTVRKTLYQEAREAGANVVDIKQHLKPEMMGNPCHRIRANVFRVDDSRPFEDQVFWYPERKLVLDDFRADTINRPFLAATQSGLFYFLQTIPPSNELMIMTRARFNPELSYFKRSGIDSIDVDVLAHEQLHFDISEVYARKLYKALTEQQHNKADLNSTANPIFNDILKQLTIKQDEYDADVYEHPEHQQYWKEWVVKELERLEAYAEKEGFQ